MAKWLRNWMEGNPSREDYVPQQKTGAALFAQALQQNFWGLVKVNLLFVLFALPFTAWSFINLGIFVETLSQASENYVALLQTQLQRYLFGCVPALALSAPSFAALNAVTKFWAEDMHVFLWSDFWEAYRQNWKQAVPALALFGGVLAVGYFSAEFYGALVAQSVVYRVLQIAVSTVSFLFLGAYLYLLPMMVSYSFTFKELLHNSLRLSLGKFPQTLLFALLSILPLLIGLVAIFFTLYAVMAVLVYYLLFGFAFAMLVNNSMANTVFLQVFGKTRNSAQESEE